MVVQIGRHRSLVTCRLRRADDMRRHDQRDAEDRQPGRGAKRDQRQPNGRGCHRRYPPCLPRQEVGRRHARKLGRQAEARRQGEHREAGKSPDEARSPRRDAAGDLGNGDEQQREADARHDVSERGKERALGAVGGHPGVRVVLVGTARGVMVVLVILGGGSVVVTAARVFIGFRLQDQRNGEEGLQPGHHKPGHEPGQRGQEDRVAKNSHVWSPCSVAGKCHRMPVVVAGIVDDVHLREADEADDEQAEKPGQRQGQHVGA